MRPSALILMLVSASSLAWTAMANAQERKVIIELAGDFGDTASPTLVVSDTECCQLVQGQKEGRWEASLNQIIFDGLAVLGEIDVEPRRERDGIVELVVQIPRRLPQNELILIRSDKSFQPDEASVWSLWNDRALDQAYRSSAEVSKVLGYLPRLHRVARTFTEPNRRISAAGVRAAFLYLRALRKLSEDSWIMVSDPSPEREAVRYLERVEKARLSRWLSPERADEVRELIRAVEYREGQRLARIYNLVAGRLESKCDSRKRDELDAMYQLFSKSTHRDNIAGIRSISGIDEVRLANEYAACALELVKCATEAELAYRERLRHIDRSIELLNDALQSFQTSPNRKSALSNRRLAKEHREALEELRPIYCIQDGTVYRPRAVVPTTMTEQPSTPPT